MSGLKPRVYLDTTVPSALLDDRTLFRQEATRLFWEAAFEKYRLCVSELSETEISQTPVAERREALLELIAELDFLLVSDEARELADRYISDGIFPEKYVSDALHLAIAATNGIRFVASWNFRHLVKIATKDRVNYINATLGYPDLEIASPEQL